MDDLAAKNEAGEDVGVPHLPEELAAKGNLREQVRKAMDELACRPRQKDTNLTDADARLLKSRWGEWPFSTSKPWGRPLQVERRWQA